MTASKAGIETGIQADIGEALTVQEEPLRMPAARRRGGRTSWAPAVVIGVTVSLLSSIASVVVYDRFFAQKLVTTNISKFVLDQRDLYFQGKINKEQYVDSLNSFIAMLKSQPKNRVVILEDVVAANAEKLEPR